MAIIGTELLMSDTDENKRPPFEISEDNRKAAAEMLSSGARALSEHVKNVTAELASVNRRFEESNRRIKNGARRTSGRIV
jgi:hypothetical protein